ncbi:MAG TPA: AsmA family protein [Candidatus Binatia bacterium]|nr:AsmA family protein [Candidatus Binatia bacterium]
MAWIFGILIVLLVVVYFVATTSAFFKGVILPKASAAMHADITVSDASIHPFKEVVLHNLKIQSTGAEPLVTATEVRLQYNLMDMLGGNIRVDQLTLTTPTVALVENPDGSKNLDSILKAMSQQPKQPAPPPKPSKPAKIDIKKIALNDATIRQIKIYKNGNRDVTELSHVNVTVNDVKNGQTGKLTLSADINVDKNPPAPAEKGVLQAKLSGNFSFALTADLKPASIQGNTRLTVTRAEGSLAQAATIGANLDCDVTPDQVKQIALRFQKGDTSLGELLVTGPLSLEKSEGRLNIELFNIDKRLLNLAGASSGLDFGPTTINSTNEIQLAKGGASVTAAGQFNLRQLQVTRTNQTTPPLDLHTEYNVTVDSAAGNALLRTLTLTGLQKGNPVFKGELTSPMTISWGNTANAVGDSALNLAVTHLDLADWKPFLGDVAPAGEVNLKLQLLSQQAGKQLKFDLTSEIANLTAGSGSNQITQASITMEMHGQAADMRQFNFPEYKLQIARQNQPLVTASGSLTYDTGTGNADVQLTAQVLLAKLLQALPRPDMKVSSGTMDLKAHITQKGLAADASQTVLGNLALTGLTGQIGSNSFRSFGATADLDLAKNPQQILIRKCNGKLTEGSTVGGTIDLSGNYDLSNQSAQLTANLSGFNPAGLRPFLEPMLGDKKLVSIALNANASVQYQPQAASSIKAGLQVTNLVVNDPTGQIPATPLEASIQLDASMNKQVTDIKQCQLGLTPTSRATNQIQLTGHIDMSRTNATQGNVKLAGDSLDLTTYYDLFGGQKKSAEKQPAPTTARTAPTATPGTSAPEQEPEAKPLPFRNFVAEAAIRRLYLHGVEVADFQTTVKIDGGHVVVNPFKLTLNGAPVNNTIDLDLGVPGYKYSLAFNALAVPLAPLVDSFQPERKGQLGGTFTAQTKIDGSGTTGASLQKNLAGQFDVSSTNLNLSVVNIKSPIIKTVVNVISTIPELISNPAGGIGSLVQGLTGAAGTSGGLASELQKSPINAIVARGSIGSGKVALQQATITSSAFQADAGGGSIALAPILSNSIVNIPVKIALNRSVADRINLVPANTPTNAIYAALPDFLTITGTIGVPKEQINKVALLTVAAKGLGGSIPKLGGNAGNLLQGILGGGNASSNATGTSAPSGNLLRGLGGLLGGGSPAATNTSTNSPATNQSAVKDLLDIFGRPKK